MLRIRGDAQLILKVEMPSVCLHHYRNYRPEPFANIKYQNVPLGYDYYWAIAHETNLRIAHLISANEIDDHRTKVKSIIPAYYRREESSWERKIMFSL